MIRTNIVTVIPHEKYELFFFPLFGNSTLPNLGSARNYILHLCAVTYDRKSWPPNAKSPVLAPKSSKNRIAIIGGTFDVVVTRPRHLNALDKIIIFEMQSQFASF